MTETISSQKAKQGHKDPSILKVLSIGLILAILVWGAVEIAFDGSSTEANGLIPPEQTENPIS